VKASQLRARYWRIVFFFGRVTLGFILWEIVFPRIGLAGWTARTRSERSRSIAVRFRALAIRMGGLMIKVGQFLSARLDVLPPEITDELSGLQDEVPPEDFDGIREVAERELAKLLTPALEQELDRKILMQIQSICARVFRPQSPARDGESTR